MGRGKRRGACEGRRVACVANRRAPAPLASSSELRRAGGRRPGGRAGAGVGRTQPPPRRGRAGRPPPWQGASRVTSTTTGASWADVTLNQARRAGGGRAQEASSLRRVSMGRAPSAGRAGGAGGELPPADSTGRVGARGGNCDADRKKRKKKKKISNKWTPPVSG